MINRLVLCLLTTLSANAIPVRTLPLEGEWRLALDPIDHGIRDEPRNWRFPFLLQPPRHYFGPVAGTTAATPPFRDTIFPDPGFITPDPSTP